MQRSGFLYSDLSPPDKQNGTAVMEHMPKSLNTTGKLLLICTVGRRPILVRNDREIMDRYDVIDRIENKMGALVRSSLGYRDPFLQIG